jgi:hypothetical protein
MLVEAQSQLRDQMRARKRRAFHGDVAVELSIHVSGQRSVPATPRVVKRYLDAMRGIVYADDRQVAQLIVHRFANDWPGRRARVDSAPATEGSPPSVSIFVSPVRVSGRDWQRAFRLLEDGGRPTRRDWSPFGSDDRDLDDAIESLTQGSWGTDGDQRQAEIRGELRADAAGRGWMQRLPREMADVQRDMLQREAARLMEQLILDQIPTASDHLAATPVRYAEPLEALGVDLDGGSDRWELPGRFWLPLRSDETSWPQAVTHAMEQHRREWTVLDRAFDRALALDIGAFGMTQPGRDIDNLAHQVLSEFERIYCAGTRGTVVRYRPYRRPSNQPGIRVLVMARERLMQISTLIEDARSTALSQGPDEDN